MIEHSSGSMAMKRILTVIPTAPGRGVREMGEKKRLLGSKSYTMPRFRAGEGPPVLTKIWWLADTWSDTRERRC